MDTGAGPEDLFADVLRQAHILFGVRRGQVLESGPGCFTGGVVPEKLKAPAPLPESSAAFAADSEEARILRLLGLTENDVNLKMKGKC